MFIALDDTATHYTTLLYHDMAIAYVLTTSYHSVLYHAVSHHLLLILGGGSPAPGKPRAGEECSRGDAQPRGQFSFFIETFYLKTPGSRFRVRRGANKTSSGADTYS